MKTTCPKCNKEIEINLASLNGKASAIARRKIGHDSAYYSDLAKKSAIARRLKSKPMGKTLSYSDLKFIDEA